MKTTIFYGNLTKDWEVKTFGDKTRAASSIAINSRVGSERKTEYFELVAWGNQGVALSTYTHKGSRLLIECEPSVNAWTDKDGNKHSMINFQVRKFEFGDSKKSDDSSDHPSAPAKKEDNVLKRDDSFMRISADSFDEEMPFN